MQSLWMLFASFMFAVMGVCVKLASVEFSTSELVLYRGVVGVITLGTLIKLSGETFRTSMPGAHLWRGIIGVTSLAQLDEDIAAYEVKLSPELLAEIDKIRWTDRDYAN